jgi:hypothetical protein
MTRPSPSTLPAGEAARALDRLLLLQQVIGPDAVQQALADTGCLDARRCRLSREVIFWVVLAMGVLTDLPIRAVFQHARRLRPGEPAPPRNSLCVARRRLGVAPLRRLFARLVRPLAGPATPGATYKGLHLVAVDGTVLDVPDSPANARAFGRLTGGRGDGAFPQVRKLSLVEVGTHAELAFVAKPVRRQEPAMVPGLLRHLRPDMLVIWDRNFCGYDLWRQLRGRGAQVLLRAKAGLVLRPAEHLADGSYLAKIYPRSYHRDKDRLGVVVRVIRYTLDDPQRVGHGQEHVLLTSLLDAAAHPAAGLVLLYHERWEAELTFDEQKTHHDPRRAAKPAHLRSQTPAGVVQELYALSIGHYVTRALMAEAAAREGLDPDRLSFAGCLRVLRSRLPEYDGRSARSWAEWYAALLWELGQERLPSRRNRVNPRVVKRKMSKFRKKRPERRPAPPLKKRFAETVVMLQ